MIKAPSGSASDLVREHAREIYVDRARRRQERTFTINVGDVHKAAALHNRVPLVCQALESEKFLKANALKLISKTGPPSGRSTTVTYTYEFLDDAQPSTAGQDAWDRLRGALKDVFAELGGGEAYLRAERASFNEAMERREGRK